MRGKSLADDGNRWRINDLCISRLLTIQYNNGCTCMHFYLRPNDILREKASKALGEEVLGVCGNKCCSLKVTVLKGTSGRMESVLQTNHGDTVFFDAANVYDLKP
jgi:hypothetical protein